MHRKSTIFVTFAAVALALAAGLAGGAGNPAGQCAAAKLKATGKKAAGKLKCYAKAIGKGVAVSESCLGKEESKFASAIGKAEGKGGCATPGNGGTLEQLVDDFVADVVVALQPDQASGRKCAAAKLKATGKKAAAKLLCEAKPLAKGGSTDPACLDKAEAKFAGAFAKADGKGGCAATGDAGPLEDRVDELVDAALAAVTATTTTTTIVATTTSSTPPTTAPIVTTTTIATTTTKASTTVTTTSTTTTRPATSSTSTTHVTTTTSGTAVCGNGVREGAEQCDDGNDLNTDACTNTCQNARCGDGFTYQGMEECDDGNAVDTDFCKNDCHYAPAVCGDGFRQFGETCDDGNTLDGDDCPPDCTINSCVATGTRQLVSVNYSKAPSLNVGGLVVFIHYPDGTVGIPGLGNATSVRARILNLQTGFTHVANDLDYAIRETIAPQTAGSSLAAGLIFKISFDLCFNAQPPTAANFACAVQGASTPQGQDIDLAQNPITCSVTVP